MPDVDMTSLKRELEATSMDTVRAAVATAFEAS
jgi:hypothetical protein